jgi:hypothetical protein
MPYFNAIIGFFDGSGMSQVMTSRFYSLKGGSDKFKGQTPDNGALKTRCMSIPTIFTDEITPNRVPMARIGWITNIVRNGRAFAVSYRLPSGIPPIPADRMADAVGLTNPASGIGDMQHSHWSIMEGDLFKNLVDAGLLENTSPSVFHPVSEASRPNLVSAMMPFSREFSGVYEAIKEACEEIGAECNRADNIWEHSTVIQDIYSLIHQSAVVVCDFSGKNPNVFYEAGIAHTLGREVVPIVQHASDIPFDLQHHRYIQYLNNAEGLVKLTSELTPRLQTLINK